MHQLFVRWTVSKQVGGCRCLSGMGRKEYGIYILQIFDHQVCAIVCFQHGAYVLMSIPFEQL